MKKHKKLLLVLGGILLCVLTLVALEATNVTNFLKNDSSEQSSNEPAKTTSKTPSAQPDFSDGDDRQPNDTTQPNKGSAIVNEGNAGAVDTSNPVVSNTGEITAYSPKVNAKVGSEATLSGTSTLPRVEYRIIDSVSGVIASGSLNVTNGKFSGKITFDTTANEGRIDLFAVRSDFSEYSYIEIPIKFEN